MYAHRNLGKDGSKTGNRYHPGKDSCAGIVPTATTWQMEPSAEENAEVAFKGSRRQVSSSFAGLLRKPLKATSVGW